MAKKATNQMPAGMHRMPNGMPMKNSDMTKTMKNADTKEMMLKNYDKMAKKGK